MTSLYNFTVKNIKLADWDLSALKGKVRKREGKEEEEEKKSDTGK